MSWVAAAFVSAFFAGVTSVLAKCGIKQTDSDVATAIRTCVVLVFAWAMAGISGSIGTIGSIEPRSWLFLVLSGLATGASWICYFKALGIGDVNKVVPVDKMSTVLAALIAIVLFGETSNLAVKLVGTAVITLGTFLMIEKKQSAGPELQQDRTWLAYALGAAGFAALTSILARLASKASSQTWPRQSAPAWYWLWHGRSWQPRENWIRSRTLTGANSHFSQHRASRPEHRGCSITTPSPQAR